MSAPSDVTGQLSVLLTGEGNRFAFWTEMTYDAEKDHSEGRRFALRRMICLLFCLTVMLSAAASGEMSEVYPVRIYEQFSHKIYRSYESETLKYRIETFKIKGVRCYLTKIWMQDPGKQIRKATEKWHKNIKLPDNPFPCHWVGMPFRLPYPSFIQLLIPRMFDIVNNT